MDENQSNKNTSSNSYESSNQNYNNYITGNASQSFRSASPTTTEASYRAFEGNSKKPKASSAGFGKTVVLPFCMRSTWNCSCCWLLPYCSSY